MKYFLLFIVAVSIGLGTVYYAHSQDVAPPTATTTVQPTRMPSPTLFSMKNPPSESLIGTLDDSSGTVMGESRVATESSPITSPAAIQQGDYIETGEDGTASIIFPTIGTISMEANTQLQIVQTLPANAVFLQRSGVAEYARTGKIPLSIRALNLLIDLEEESVFSITIDEEEGSVVVRAEQGSGVAAYNDVDFETVKVIIEEGQELMYDSVLRESELQ